MMAERVFSTIFSVMVTFFLSVGGSNRMSSKSVVMTVCNRRAPLGTGMDLKVDALTVYDNKLIAGSDFTTAGRDSAKG